MKNLNEELNKMRRLMDFDISENSHDVLSESNIRKSILKEQTTTGRTDQFYGDEDIESDQKFLNIDNKDFTKDTNPKKVNPEKENRKKLKQMYKNGEITKDEYKNLKRGGSPNWKRGYSGFVKFGQVGSRKPIAENVLEGNYNIYYDRGVTNSNITPPVTGTTDTTPPIPWELPKVELLGDGSIPFADNMVTPAWDKFPEAKKRFDEIIKRFGDFITNGGFDNIKSITIQGSADSARPTETKPSGYPGLDHPNGIYGGETDDYKRNQYLADMRAKMYANSIVESVKELTGKDLSVKFNYLKGLNYYGSEDDERGPEFRKITLTIDADDIPGIEGEKGGVVTYSFFVDKLKRGDIIEMFTFPVLNGKMVPVIRRNTGYNNKGDIFIPNTDQIDPITKETIPYSKILNDMEKMVGMMGAEFKGVKRPEINPNTNKPTGKEVDGVEFFINNKSLGDLRSPIPGEFESSANICEKYLRVVGDKKLVYTPKGIKCIWSKGDEQDGMTQISSLWFGLRKFDPLC